MVRAFAIFSMAFALSVCTYAQSNDEKEAPKVKVIQQAGSPVSIDEYTFYPNRMRVICRVMNRSDQRIIAVRLGWFVTSTNQETTTHFGEMYRIPVALRPSASMEVNALHIPDLQGSQVARITMFVAEALYSDGYKWRTDINSLRSELERRLRYALPHREEATLMLHTARSWRLHHSSLLSGNSTSLRCLFALDQGQRVQWRSSDFPTTEGLRLFPNQSGRLASMAIAEDRT